VPVMLLGPLHMLLKLLQWIRAPRHPQSRTKSSLRRSAWAARNAPSLAPSSYLHSTAPSTHPPKFHRATAAPHTSPPPDRSGNDPPQQVRPPVPRSPTPPSSRTPQPRRAEIFRTSFPLPEHAPPCGRNSKCAADRPPAH